MTIKNKKQSGRSMIEMLGVLAIVGILSAGGIAGYSMAMENHKTNLLIEKMHLIAQQTRTLYNNQDIDTNINIDTLINSGLITDKKDPFGGDLSVNSSTLGSGIFWVKTSNNTPVNACIKILMANWGSDGMFRIIQVDDTPFSTGRTGRQHYPIPLNIATSTCAGGNKQVMVGFKN